MYAEASAVCCQYSCCLVQDLEVQNNELVDINEKLQKEVAALRNMAKEALLEKKKSQAALEAFKHQVSWLDALPVSIIVTRAA